MMDGLRTNLGAVGFPPIKMDGPLRASQTLTDVFPANGLIDTADLSCVRICVRHENSPAVVRGGLFRRVSHEKRWRILWCEVSAAPEHQTHRLMNVFLSADVSCLM